MISQFDNLKEIIDFKKNSSLNFKKQSLKDLQNLPKLNGIFDFKFYDLEFKMLNINNDDGVSLKFFWRDEYEPLSLKLWKNITKNGQAYIDVGSHTGIYSIIGNLSNKSNCLISVEPYNMNYYRLLCNLRLNSISTNNSFNFAASNKEGEVSFRIHDIDDYHKKNYHSAGGKIDNKGQIKVKTLLMDNFQFSSINKKVECIKIDTEGHEAEVIEGSAKLIKEFYPDFIIEVNESSFENSLNLLKEHNYKFYFIDEENNKIIEINENDKQMIKQEGQNFFCTKRNSDEINNLLI
tara:strand:+ start:1794 stop:2672 length:879 start_codon:yes stop_codon:yes gene_type:complete